MRFMMLVIPKGYQSASPGTLPAPELVERMSRYNESLERAGVLLALDGLQPPSTGARVSFAAGRPPRHARGLPGKRPLPAAF